MPGASPSRLSSLPSSVSGLPSSVSSLPSSVGALPSSVSSLPPSVGALPSSVSSLPSSVSSLPSSVSSLPSSVSGLPSSVSSLPWSVGAPLSSVGAPPSSVGAPPSSVSSLPWSVGAPLSSVGAPPSSVGVPPSSVSSLPWSVGAPPSSVSGQPRLGLTSSPRASKQVIGSRVVDVHRVAPATLQLAPPPPDHRSPPRSPVLSRRHAACSPLPPCRRSSTTPSWTCSASAPSWRPASSRTSRSSTSHRTRRQPWSRRLSTSSCPPLLRADLVIDLRDARGTMVLAIVLEVQRDKDPDKKYAWALYVAAVRARKRCPAILLVIAPDPRVARWAAQPIRPGHGAREPAAGRARPDERARGDGPDRGGAGGGVSRCSRPLRTARDRTGSP